MVGVDFKSISHIISQNYHFWHFYYQTQLDSFLYPQSLAMFEKKKLNEFASTTYLVFLLQKLLI